MYSIRNLFLYLVYLDRDVLRSRIFYESVSYKILNEIFTNWDISEIPIWSIEILR